MSKQTIPFIDLKSQYRALEQQIKARLDAVLESGQYILGREVREVEAELAAFTGAKHCLTVASGTEALLIALMALGVKAGDEVITTPFTFVATAEVIALLGATPVFVDIQEDIFCLDPALLEVAITPRTKAIIPVSLYGQVADMAEINAIAARHGGIPVIEDAAQSFGASYQGGKSGNLSTIGCTSFFPSKPLGCYGDGGALFTNDDHLAKVCGEIRVHGQDRRYHHARIGVGGRMDTMQCAVLLAKLERFEWEVAQRQAVGQRYIELLAQLPGVTPPKVRADRTSVWGQFTIQVADREAVLGRLEKAGIPTAVHYPVPLHRQPAYQGVCRMAGGLAVSEAAANRVLSLPMHPYLDQATQDAIVRAVAAAV